MITAKKSKVLVFFTCQGTLTTKTEMGGWEDCVKSSADVRQAKRTTSGGRRQFIGRSGKG